MCSCQRSLFRPWYTQRLPALCEYIDSWLCDERRKNKEWTIWISKCETDKCSNNSQPRPKGITTTATLTPCTIHHHHSRRATLGKKHSTNTEECIRMEQSKPKQTNQHMMVSMQVFVCGESAKCSGVSQSSAKKTMDWKPMYWKSNLLNSSL